MIDKRMYFRGDKMAEVLMFNIEKSKAVKIKVLCRKFFMEATEVSKEDFGCKISYLLGMSEYREGAENSDFSEEMLYLADRSAQTKKGFRWPQGRQNGNQRKFYGV